MKIVADERLPCSTARALVPESLTVLVAQDHRVLRDQLVSVLGAQPDVVVVGTARDLESLTQSAGETKPLIVLLDASLCGRLEGGHACIARVRSVAPEARVVVTNFPVDDMICFVEAGVFGFVMKDATIEQLLATLRAVGKGEKVLPGELAAALFAHVARHAIGRPALDDGRAVRLTSREREVVGLVAHGLSNKEIAGRLSLTTYTIKSHVHNVLEKLALHSRLELAAHAHESERRSHRA